MRALNLAWWYLYGEDSAKYGAENNLEVAVLVKECPKYGWVTKDFHECGTCQERCK